MASFGTKSLERLDTCDPQLQELMKLLVQSYDVSILCGHRTEDEQTEAYEAGNSKLQFPESKHNTTPSMAVDVAPYPIDWDDTKRFYYMAGLVKALAEVQGTKVRWGGDWDSDGDFKDQSFNDLVHFELV